MQTQVSKKSQLKRLHILKTGADLVLHKGFSTVGLQEILSICQIPKGSFYHYFQSKEQFGCALLEDYIAAYHTRLDQIWNSNALAKQQLIRYFKLWIDDPNMQCGWADSCLIVKLAAEVSDLSEDMRCIMAQGVAQLMQRITALIELGKQDHSINIEMDATSLSQIIYPMWLGAALLSKLQKDKAPLTQALYATEFMLTPQKTSI